MRVAVLTLLAVVASILGAQGNPPPMGAFTFTGGVWSPASTSSVLSPSITTPPPAAMYCYNSSTKQWVPADSSCFGFGSGTVNSGTTGQIAYYAGNGTAVSGTSTPTSTFLDKGGAIFNVKAYGAKGDDTTDDRASIISAATAAASATGGFVFFPAGFYKISASITWPTGVSILGASPQLQAIPGQNPDIIMTPIGGSWLDCAGVANCLTGSSLRSVNIEHMGFENATAAAISFGGDGLDGISFSHWHDVTVVGSTTTGASDEGIRLNNIQHLNMIGINVYNVNTCMDFINQSSTISGSNSEIYSLYCKSYPISAANGNNTKSPIQIRVLQPTVGTASNLNYLHFVRPQINSYNGDGTGTLVSITGLNSTSHVNGIVFDDADIEGTPLTGFYADYYSAIKLGINSQAMSTVGNTTFVLTSNILGGAAIDSQDGGSTFSIPVGVTISGRFANATMTNQYGVFIPQSSSQVYGIFNGAVNLQQSIAATSGANQQSPCFNLSGTVWNGSASILDTWCWYDNPTASGANPASNLVLSHSGSSGTPAVGIPYKVNFAGGTTVMSNLGELTLGSAVYLNPNNGIQTTTLQSRSSGTALDIHSQANAGSLAYGVALYNSNALNKNDVFAKWGSSTGYAYLLGGGAYEGTFFAGQTQTAISSATTIAPTAAVFHVTGTTTIQTITAPTDCTVSGYACQITIIPDGVFATNTSGNIALASTSVVSKALIMTYDPGTSKWYPSY